MNVKKLNSILLAGILCLFPLGIQASTTYATSEDGTKNYTSIDDAWDAAQNGTKIIMSSDWNISSRLVLDSNKTATIEMNGHKISRGLSDSKSNGEVIKLCSNSTLNLNGKNASKTKFVFQAYNIDGSRVEVSTVSGGLITGGYSTNGAGGIHMKGGSKLNLDTVSISGNKSERSWGSDGHGGGIYMDGSGDQLIMNNAEITFNAAQRDGGGVYVNNKNSTVELNNNSLIVENSAGANVERLDSDQACGGGIAIDGEDVTITLNSGSNVNDNYAHGFGGGIYSRAKGSKIYLNASGVNLNQSDNTGGGVYFYYSNFEVSSTNSDGEISGNIAKGAYGGGLYAARCVFTGNEGKIHGITFDGNSCYSGGGIEIHQENVTVSNCTFTNNKANHGGAINIENDNFVLENSTIQNNITTDQKSGAVDVDQYNDITLNGIITITNNTNETKDYEADLYMNTGGWLKSYILSIPDASSKIGLYIDDARTLAKNQTTDTTNIYYVNNSNNYTISYDENLKEIISKATPGGGASFDWGESEQEETQSYNITMNMVNEAGTWQNTQKMTVDENTLFELQAPAVENKEFVEFKDVAESITVENDFVKADSISEDIEITLVYSDEESESLETSSIFGDDNTIVTTIIIVALVVLGAFIFIKKKKA